VTIVSKSGTNEAHGSLFDYYSTPWFRAKGFFNSVACYRHPSLSRRLDRRSGADPKFYDGRNKTFFFFSFETSRGSALQDRLKPDRRANALENRGLLRLGYADPRSVECLPFANNGSRDRLNSVSQKIQSKFFPQPNFGDPNTFHTQNYRNSRSDRGTPPLTGLSRVDHKVSDKDRSWEVYLGARPITATGRATCPLSGSGGNSAMIARPHFV